jgi:hypothetical protein
MIHLYDVLVIGYIFMKVCLSHFLVTLYKPRYDTYVYKFRTILTIVFKINHWIFITYM